MFRDSSNPMLYHFDTIAGDTTGALESDCGAKTIEVHLVNPSDPASFQYALDVIWQGAVATFEKKLLFTPATRAACGYLLSTRRQSQ